MELRSSLPHPQQSTTCPYPNQSNPFLCPSHLRQAQLVSFLVGLRTYQHSKCIFNLPFGVVFLKTLTATTQKRKSSGNILFWLLEFQQLLKEEFLTGCGMLKFELSHSGFFLTNKISKGFEYGQW